jgi:hypothetical protein
MSTPCTGCGHPIRETDAAISENTPTTSRHWHHACCPWVPRASTDSSLAHCAEHGKSVEYKKRTPAGGLAGWRSVNSRRDRGAHGNQRGAKQCGR